MIASVEDVGSFLTRPHMSPYVEEGDSSHVAEVRGYHVKEWGPALSEAQVLVLREVLLQAKNYDLERSRCEFSPNIGFTFSSQAHAVTALVAHGCRCVSFDEGGGHVDASINLRLLEIGVALFPNDERIGSHYARESLPKPTVGTRMLPEVVGCK